MLWCLVYAYLTIMLFIVVNDNVYTYWSMDISYAD